MLEYQRMKLNKVWSTVLVLLTLACNAPMASADQSILTPPRGRAYGCRLKEGGLLLFLYSQEDGSRQLKLYECHPKWRYEIAATEDLQTWQVLSLMEIQDDGTGLLTDTEPRQHRVLPGTTHPLTAPVAVPHVPQR